jgi:hypothetical protein
MRIKGILGDVMEAGSPKGPNKNKTWRESFLDKIKGPNEKRFEPFNNMPRIYSKYKNLEAALSIDKQCTRDERIIGGEIGIGPKKDIHQREYDANYEFSKSALNVGRKN